MEKQHPIGDLMSNIVEKVREIADVNTIVGQPIAAGEVSIIPISRLSVGVGSGGTEFGSKHQKPDGDNCFGGGAGAGVNLIPVGFLVVKGDSVKLLPVAPPAGTPAGTGEGQSPGDIGIPVFTPPAVSWIPEV